MCRLVLNVGDKVRNIRQGSSRKGKIGTVTETSHTHYRVIYANGLRQDYLKDMAHISLEKIVNECPCQQQAFRVAITGGLTGQQLEQLKQSTFGFVVAGDDTTKRRVLKKVRRNIITGKTQDDFVREMGHAKGVQQFNTRALGKSTGQALACIGQAMMHPGLEIRISQVDHAKSNPLCSTSWTTLDKHFRLLVQSLIGNMKGFTITDTHIVFNPIITEETYVEL